LTTIGALFRSASTPDVRKSGAEQRGGSRQASSPNAETRTAPTEAETAAALPEIQGYAGQEPLSPLKAPSHNVKV
jgi:hypothetical protein